MIIAEENHSYGELIGNSRAPFLNKLATTYASATNFYAGYPVHCPSLAAYILMTSGTTGGICDDRAPKAHPLAGPNIFQQVADSGRQWRGYAESSPGNCARLDGDNGRYLVRHVPATYYLSERERCAEGVVPLGDSSSGALHDAVAGGALPAFSYVTPDACHDMHGADPCDERLVVQADQWLATWLPQIMAGPDYTSGHLVVIVTWDEGSRIDNHIPTIVVAPQARGIAYTGKLDHCSTLRTVEDLLDLPTLGCATAAPSMVPAMHLAPAANRR